MSALDTAVKAASDAAAAAQSAASGGLRWVTGSYVGNGQGGSGYYNRLTFDRKPLVIFVCGNASIIPMVYGATISASGSSDSSKAGSIYLSWSARGVSWYSNDGAAMQANKNGFTYFYFALLEP